MPMPAAELRRKDDAWARAEAFARRFTEAHVELAMHAAVPAGLSPELVHLIRVNFVPGAPFIAEADLLLSSLCIEVGGGLYEMDPEVRSTLRTELATDPQYGPARIRAVSEFLLAWTERALLSEHNPDTRAHLRTLQWSGVATLAPGAAAQELAAALRNSLEADDSDETLRLVRLTDSMALSLAGQATLLRYAAGLGNLLEGDSRTAGHLFDLVGMATAAPSIEGVELPPPAVLRSALDPRARASAATGGEEEPVTAAEPEGSRDPLHWSVADNVVSVGTADEHGPRATGLWIDPHTIVTAAEPFRGLSELQVRMHGSTFSAKALEPGGEGEDAGLLFLALSGSANSEPAQMSDDRSTEKERVGVTIVVNTGERLEPVYGELDRSEAARFAAGAPTLEINVAVGPRQERRDRRTAEFPELSQVAAGNPERERMLGAPVILGQEPRPAGIVVEIRSGRPPTATLRVATTSLVRSMLDVAYRHGTREPERDAASGTSRDTFAAKVVITGENDADVQALIEALAHDFPTATAMMRVGDQPVAGSFPTSPDMMRGLAVLPATGPSGPTFVCGFLAAPARPDWPFELSMENASAIVVAPSYSGREMEQQRGGSTDLVSRVRAVAASLEVPFIDPMEYDSGPPPSKVPSKMRPIVRRPEDPKAAADVIRRALRERLPAGKSRTLISGSEIGALIQAVDLAYRTSAPAVTYEEHVEQWREPRARWSGVYENLTGMRLVPDVNLAFTDPRFFQTMTLELFRRVKELAPGGLPAVPVGNLHDPPLDEKSEVGASGALVPGLIAELVRMRCGRTIETYEGPVFMVPALQAATGLAPSGSLSDTVLLRADLASDMPGSLCAVAAHMYYMSRMRITEVDTQAVRFRGSGSGDVWLRTADSQPDRLILVPDAFRSGGNVDDVVRAAEEAIRAVDQLASITPGFA